MLTEDTHTDPWKRIDERAPTAEELRKAREPRVPDALTFVNVEVSSACNSRCPMCPHGYSDMGRSGRPGLMSLDVLERVLANVRANCTLVNLYLFGEPLLHPELPRMVEMTRALGMAAATSTNGILLTPDVAAELRRAGLKTLCVSFDAITRESFERLRGGGHDRVWGNLEALAAERERLEYPELTMRVVKTRERDEEVEPFLDRIAALRIFRSVTFCSFYPWPGQDVTRFEPLKRWSKEKPCRCVYGPMNILSDGRGTICGFDSGGEMATADLASRTLVEELNNEATLRLRRMHLDADRKSIPLCASCEGPAVVSRTVGVALDSFAGGSAEHRREVVAAMRKL